MGQEGYFKSAAFGGFDRQSVLDYIDSLTGKFHTAEAEYQRRIEEFKKAQESQVAYIKKMEGQYGESQEKLETLAGELENRRTVDGGMQQKLEKLENELAAKTKRLSEVERELLSQSEQARQLQFKAESLGYKSKKYDEISNQIGDAMIEARRAGDLIANEAKAEAERLREEAKIYSKQTAVEVQAQAELAREEARKEAEEMLFDAREQADHLSAQAVQQVTLAEAQLRGLREQAASEAEEFAARTQSRIKSYYSEMECFQGDTSRLRKSIEEILFVLNDRVDVMQEIVRKMKDRVEAEQGPQQAAEVPELFSLAEDEAGHFSTVSVNN